MQADTQTGRQAGTGTGTGTRGASDTLTWVTSRGVRMPATTSSPCALGRYSPYSFFSPVAGLRVKHTPGEREGAGVARARLST